MGDFYYELTIESSACFVGNIEPLVIREGLANGPLTIIVDNDSLQLRFDYCQYCHHHFHF